METYDTQYREHGPLKIATIGRYSAHAVARDGTRECAAVIGPDITGRLCVIGRYSSHGRAVEAAREMGLRHGPVRGERYFWPTRRV